MIALSEADIARCREIADQHKTAIRLMIEEVAAETGVPVKHILGRKMDRQTVHARQLAMFLAVRAGNSLPKVGAVFNRDHTTVLHGVRAEERRRANSLQALEHAAKLNGPGGASNATPGPDHGNLDERSDTMANACIIPIPGRNAITEVNSR